MNNLKTFEGFFKGKSIGNIFNKQDDDFAQKVFNSLKKTIESEEVTRVVRYGDYKRRVEFKSNGELYNISIQKSLGRKSLLSSGDNFILVVNNRHFLDRKTGNSTISQSLLKKIWNLLDIEQDRRWMDREKMEKDFE